MPRLLRTRLGCRIRRSTIPPSVPHSPLKILKFIHLKCSERTDVLQAKHVAMQTKLHNVTRALEGATNKLAKVQTTTKALEGTANELAKLTK